jgi:hypothetical protein
MDQNINSEQAKTPVKYKHQVMPGRLTFSVNVVTEDFVLNFDFILFNTIVILRKKN